MTENAKKTIFFSKILVFGLDYLFFIGIIRIVHFLTNPNEGAEKMKHTFYDVKAKAKVEAEVDEFVTYGEGTRKRYAFKAQTADGRPLTAFVGKDTWEKAKK